MFQKAVAALSGRLLPLFESFSKTKDTDQLQERIESVAMEFGMAGGNLTDLLTDSLFDSIIDKLRQLSSISQLEYWRQLHRITASFSQKGSHSVVTQELLETLDNAIVIILDTSCCSCSFNL